MSRRSFALMAVLTSRSVTRSHFSSEDASNRVNAIASSNPERSDRASASSQAAKTG